MGMFKERLKGFTGTAPIFPLPNIVFYPKTFFPLHIFEPRYRQMVTDAENGEKMICMALLKPGYEEDYEGAPPLHTIGTLGYMEFKNNRSDETSDILLVGVSKVKISEVESNHDYRIADLDPISESIGEEDPEVLKEKVFPVHRPVGL